MPELLTIAPLDDQVPTDRPDAGPAPQLQWLPIALLRVDPAYQRPITAKGRQNIVKIVKEFRWNRFAPVVVSPIAGGLYAIVDGQHRTTAAATVGLESVPCLVILADAREQAAAFSAINGAVTRMHKMSIHHAAVAAGDPAACEIDAVARAAGVTILRYPKSELHQAPGETMAIGSIAEAIAAHGEAATVLALKAIREPPNNVRGGLTGPIIRATAAMAAFMLERNATDADVIGFISRRVLIRESDKARTTGRPKGVAVWSELFDRLRRGWVPTA